MSGHVRSAVLLFAGSLSLLYAQGTKTRDDAAKYSAHADVGSVKLGADYWGRVIPVEGANLRTESYLVIEVALFPPPKSKVSISAGQFVLKVNGQKLVPQSPGNVTLGMVMPDMREQQGPHLETEGQVGPVIVSSGKDPAQPNFPGDNVPNPKPPLGQPSVDVPQGRLDPAKAVKDAALPEGTQGSPVSGYLFYPWSGKLKRIKQVELEYASEAGNATLILQ